LGRICSDQVTSTQIFSHGSDSTDSDFIQDHIDSFFPPADPKEEDCENRSDYSIDYVVNLVDYAVDMLVAGFAYVRDLVQTLGEMIVEWGMRVIDAIGEAFSAVRDAVSEVGEFIKSLINHLVERFYSNMYDLTLRLQSLETEVKENNGTEASKAFVGIGIDAMRIAIELIPIVLIVSPERLQDVALDAWEDALNITETSMKMVYTVTGTVVSLISMSVAKAAGRVEVAVTIGTITLAYLLVDLYLLIQEED